MRILLDTHSLVWYLEGDVRLSERAKEIIDNTNQEIFASHISFFEIAIKMQIGKFPSDKPLFEFIEATRKNDIGILAISTCHLTDYSKIPLVENHRDPFDRLLIATALNEKLHIITADDKFNYYKDIVHIIW
ncbi:type II toxin-antitoxin system VapC family toxin [Dyadobacter flavalbus]|uniref:Type II toxin-antitoxin system VapC family toxin n=1 Tax=Dyadobacter flavalbus TaxID=2579942 RepID=A0A5M8QN29_9BACT|nr:type II toxin-antitoxin system VapC family toxin [Dyadobacter flavalbus]KAA6436668.1 type II toxin-antitoxin system VapC family toxin [Dyadobacter flavalbus]